MRDYIGQPVRWKIIKGEKCPSFNRAHAEMRETVATKRKMATHSSVA